KRTAAITPRSRPGTGNRATGSLPLPLADLSAEAKILPAMVGDQQSARAGVTLEQLAEGAFLLWPGIGEDDTKILSGQAEILMSRRLSCREPSKETGGPRQHPGGRGNEAALSECNRQIKDGGETPGRANEPAVHLDTTGIKFQQRGQAGNHAEAAAPLAKQCAGGFRLRRQMLEDAVGAAEIAGDKGRAAVAAMEPSDASVRLVQEGIDAGGNRPNRTRSRRITQGHA